MGDQGDQSTSQPAAGRPRSGRPQSARPRSARPVDLRTSTVVMACLQQMKQSLMNSAGGGEEVQEGVREMFAILGPILAQADAETQHLLAQATMVGDMEALEALVLKLEPQLQQLLETKDPEDEMATVEEEAPAGPGEDDDEEAGAAEELEPPPLLETCAVHRAAWSGDMDLAGLRTCASAASKEQKDALDVHGNTALHIAVLRKQLETTSVLLELGFDPTVVNKGGWTSLELALLQPYGWFRENLVRRVYKHMRTQSKLDFDKHKPKLLEALEAMPDFKTELTWKLDSKLFGKLVQRYAPNDTYVITKSGLNLRVDSTLKGMSDRSASGTSLGWKRGRLSVYFHGLKGLDKESSIHLVDHDEQTIVDMMSSTRDTEEDLEMELQQLMQTNVEHMDVAAQKVSFQPARRMLGGEVTETVFGWKTKVFVASATLKGKRVVGRGIDPLLLQLLRGSFDEYIAAAPQPCCKKRAKKAESSEMVTERSHTLKGRAWMAEGFPLTAEQLIPILDILIPSNRHLQAMKRFAASWMQKGERLFPVRVQIPLLLSVYAMVSFPTFELGTAPDSHFELPMYDTMTLDEVMDNLFLADTAEVDQGYQEIELPSPRMDTSSS
mmetsp:Transcript_26726/g.50882  ORF Transcript_26726/g.50882 Transcript_26726/m.50882 type:complete len:611 (+) Transcript_26726:106-1938(+)